MERSPSTHARWRTQFLTFILLTTAGAGAYFLGVSLADTNHSPPRDIPSLPKDEQLGLVVDKKHLNLGEIWETPSYTAIIPVQNNSTRPILVKEFATSCDCTSVEPKSLELQPGQVADLRIQLDLTHRLTHQQGLTRRVVSIRINPVYQDDSAPSPGWELKGIIRSRINLSDSRLDFLDMCTHHGPITTRKIRATAHIPLHHIEAEATPPLAKIHIESVADLPDQYDILISPNPSLPLGSFNFEVRVKAVTNDGVTHPCGAVQVVGEVQPFTRVVPSVVMFGEVKIGKTVEAEIAIHRPSENWSVERIESDSPETTAAKIGREKSGIERYRLTQRIARVGDKVSRLSFVIRDPQGNLETVHVQTRYFGIADEFGR